MTEQPTIFNGRRLPEGEHYTLERWSDGVLARTVTHISGTSFDDTQLTSGKTYLYRVKAFDASEEGVSSFSAWDLATVMAFNPIAAGVTVVSLADINQLLDAVNSVRGAAF